MTDKVVDVIIIGAGIAGLTAAYELKKRSNNLKILVLEAKNRVGGRTCTITLRSSKGTDQWDIGGQWVGLTQLQVLDLLKELKIEIYPQYTAGKKLAQIGSEKIRYYTGTLPIKDFLTFQYSPLELLDFAIFMTKMEKMAKQLNPNDIFDHPSASEWDSFTVDHFARTNTRTSTVREAIDAMCFIALGIHSDRISLLYLLLYGRRAGSVTDFLEATGNGAQGFRIKGGSQQISEILTDKIGYDNVLVDHPVEKIVYGESWAEVHVKNNNQQVFRSKKVILAIPPQQAGYISYDPLLPGPKRQLLGSFPPANLIKFVVTYPEAFWRTKGFSGEIVARGDAVTDNSLSRPVICTFDATTSHNSPAILGFLSLAWCDKPETERRDAALKDLARFLGPEALTYVDYVDKDWSEEPYNGGCPVGILPPGMMRTYEEACAVPVGCLHWAGTETAQEWCGYMSGAVQSGLRTAHEVLFDLNPSAVQASHLSNTALDPDYRKAKLRSSLKRQKNRAKNGWFSGCSCVSWVLLGAAGVITYLYFAKRSTSFDSPVKAKFIYSF